MFWPRLLWRSVWRSTATSWCASAFLTLSLYHYLISRYSGGRRWFNFHLVCRCGSSLSWPTGLERGGFSYCSVIKYHFASVSRRLHFECIVTRLPVLIFERIHTVTSRFLAVYQIQHFTLDCARIIWVFIHSLFLLGRASSVFNYSDSPSSGISCNTCMRRRYRVRGGLSRVCSNSLLDRGVLVG